MIPVSLYVHFPWCLRKCPYCDFNSHIATGNLPEDAWLAALIRDLDAEVGTHTFESVFIGGGTPSLMSGKTVAALLAAVRPHLAPDAEITLEANPGAIEAEKFTAFRDAGVNRLSLGVQSFDDEKLRALGRIHTADEARRAAELALSRFERVNLDLMTGLPGQTLEEARRDIETAISFAPGHVSAYALTLEPNTPFHHAPPPLPDDDLAADMQEMAEAILVAAGYEHYETSAFARPGQQCRHNLNYWTFGDYLGLGAGAHSKVGRRREARPRNPRDYLANPVSRDWQPIAPEDLPGEFMMNALRLADGFPPALFDARTGLPLSILVEELRKAEQDGLLETSPLRIAPTPLGRRFLNVLVGRFLGG